MGPYKNFNLPPRGGPFSPLNANKKNLFGPQKILKPPLPLGPYIYSFYKN